LNETIL